MKQPSLIVAGGFWHGSLEGSLYRAFKSLGCKVEAFDIQVTINKYIKFGKIGKIFSTYLPIEAWINKANREFVVTVIEKKPDILCIGGANQIRAGALAQMKASLPNLKIILIWPDTMLRVNAHVIDCLPIYDLVATYSINSVEVFESIGAKKVIWVPLAADTLLHPANVEITDLQKIKFECDVCFIGNHRPEREEIFTRLHDEGFKVKVWGHDDWKRHASDYINVKKYWQKESLYGDDFARAIKCSKVCINPIDPTNYPAANMRFFEIPGAGGVQVSSLCPEMETIFKDGETIFYYQTLENLPRIVDNVLRNEALRDKVAQQGREIVHLEHTYVNRVQYLLDILK
jgi:hypothetical protein